MSQLKTLQKCRKIMSLFEQCKPKGYQASQKWKKEPLKENNKKNVNKISRNSSKDLKQKKQFKKSDRFKQRDNSRQSVSYQSSINSSTSKSKVNTKSGLKNIGNKQNYQSPFNRETRYQKIMKLKAPKPEKRMSSRSSFIQQSLNTSMNSSFCSTQGRRNTVNSQKKLTRYQKIMNLKVSKPQVQSTLKGYTPQKSAKKQIKHRDIRQNQTYLLKQCKQKLKKQKQIQEKEDRLWKIFERQRGLRLAQKKKNCQKQYERQMSLEKRFDSLVKKQLKKIQYNRSKAEISADSSLFF